jgi:hypothetical protein
MAEARKIVQNRLPRNFHKTFIPERQYIHAMLRFAAKGGSGDVQTISIETGIPTGASSGKVAPIIDYCRGMGLIYLDEGRSAVKKPQLTHFGRAVLLEDPFLKEPLTQWLAHFHLCDMRSGAEIWYQTFLGGSARLGMEFRRDTLEEWLASACNVPKGGLIGPLVRMYEDASSFHACGALAEEAGKITRRAAPVKEYMALGYGAWIVSKMETIAKKGAQVTVTELEEKCGWRTIAAWNLMEAQRVLELVERKGVFTVDRLMTPWILKAKDTATNSWRRIYSDLI